MPISSLDINIVTPSVQTWCQGCPVLSNQIDVYSSHRVGGGVRAWADISFSMSRDGHGRKGRNVVPNTLPFRWWNPLHNFHTTWGSRPCLNDLHKPDITPSRPLQFWIVVGSSYMDPSLPHDFHHALQCCSWRSKSRSNYITDIQVFETPHTPLPQTLHQSMKSKSILKTEQWSIFWNVRILKLSFLIGVLTPWPHCGEEVKVRDCGKSGLDWHPAALWECVVPLLPFHKRARKAPSCPSLHVSFRLCSQKWKFCTVGRTGAELRHLEPRK